MDRSITNRRSPALLLVALLAVVALLSAACNPDANRGDGGGPGASGQPAASGGGGAASPGPGSSGDPGASGGTGAAEISGSLTVGAKYEDADEIATVRYDTFKEQYPDVEVTFTEADFDPQTFLTSVASGDAPDVVQMDRGIIGTYISQGAIDPLDECIASHGIDMSQYREAAVASVTYDGQVWGIPQFYDTRIVMINQSVIDEVGLKPEDIDTSDWDKLRQVNEQLMAKDGGNITRLGFDPKLPDFLPMWAAANGGSLLSEDGTESRLDDPKVAEALDFVASLVLAHGSNADFEDFRKTGPGSAFFGAENQFTEDSLGAMPMEQWYLNVLASDTPDEDVAFQPFKSRDGSPLTMAGGTAWVIPSSAKNKEAACEFAKVVTLADTWYAAAKTRADMRAEEGAAYTGTYTANTAADERIFGELVTEDSAGKFYEGVQIVLETQDAAISIPPNPAAEEFRRIWNEAVQRVLNDGVPAAEALADADQEAQSVIDSAR